MKSGLPKQYPVACHTDHIGLGSTFVAIKGFASNGALFVSRAIEKGATRIVLKQNEQLSQATLRLAHQNEIKIQRVAHTRKALAQLSAQAAGFPAKKLKILGITGTKGKTTTASLLCHILRQAGYQTALLSSVGNMIHNQTFPAPLTTAQPDYLHQFLKTCVDENIEWVVMEVAAQAISLHRIDGIEFDVVIMTNIAREHLEFYASMDAYAQAKMKLVSFCKKDAPVWLNADDARLARIDTNNLHWFGTRANHVQIRGNLLCTEKNNALALKASIIHDDKEYIISCQSLCGEYNLYNVLSAVAGSLHAGVAWPMICKAIAKFSGVPGRLEQFALPNGATAIIDHAHNPLSFQVLLSMLRAQTDQLIVIFGAGGERDHGRRPEMGCIAAEYADFVILTTDNPRSEDPEKIVADIVQSISDKQRHKVIIEMDRKQAIYKAYEASHAGSIITLLGKGTEEYQLVGTTKIPFSERKIVRAL